MTETFDIAGYCRISVDEELDRDNVSIENQKAIIRDFVNRRFPGSSLTFYEDRDRSGYTFEQREGYQAMRKGIVFTGNRAASRTIIGCCLSLFKTTRHLALQYLYVK